MKNWSRGKSFHAKTRTFSPKTARGGVVRGSDREGCCGRRPHYHKGRKRLRRAGRSRPSGASGASPGPISARKRTIFVAETSAEGKEGREGVFCSKFWCRKAYKRAQSSQMMRCPQAGKGDRRAEKSLRSRPFVGRSSSFLARFCGLLHQKERAFKDEHKGTSFLTLPTSEMPPNSARTWEISAHAEPAFCRYRCAGRRSSEGRLSRKVGLSGSFLALSTSRGFSLLNRVSLRLQTRSNS